MLHDRFHGKGHAETCSTFMHDHSSKQNTSLAEQANSRIAHISNITGHSSYEMSIFHLACTQLHFNKQRICELNREDGRNPQDRSREPQYPGEYQEVAASDYLRVIKKKKE